MYVYGIIMCCFILVYAELREELSKVEADDWMYAIAPFQN